MPPTTTKAPSSAAHRASTAESCDDAPATTSEATTATVPGQDAMIVSATCAASAPVSVFTMMQDTQEKGSLSSQRPAR